MKVAPQPGDIIRYAYLWANENRRGKSEGRKDRPALVLALSLRNASGTTELVVLAVTHTPPSDPADAVAFPDRLKRAIGLDGEPSWIVTTEANSFIWPGPDLRPIPDRRPATVIYGRVPPGFLQTIAKSFLANRDRQRAQLVPRND
ncbi:MAG TPA: plasmid maintenance toxin (PemK-like) [Parvibaculum sp.]|jgi:hypothetical protein